MFKKLRTVIYHVDDLQRAKQWYRDVTGVSPYFDEPFYVGFDINGFELGLDPDASGIERGNQAVAYWSVDDLPAVLKNLAAAGGKTIKDISDVGGGIKVAIIQDPFGNTIGLIEGA